MNGLPVKRACELTDSAQQPRWLIEGLWADQAVGILGGEPKCCKSFLALDMVTNPPTVSFPQTPIEPPGNGKPLRQLSFHSPAESKP